MVKKRKTRSDKYATDLRHQIQSHSATSPITVSLSDIGIKSDKNISPSLSTQKKHLSTSEYHFVRHDLKKTSLITSAIILIELVLFFTVKP